MTMMMMMMMMIIIIIIILQSRHSVHLLILLHISLAHPWQSQSTLYNHQSAHLPLPLMFLPFSCQSTAVPLHKMFPPTAGKSQFSYALSEVSSSSSSSQTSRIAPFDPFRLQSYNCCLQRLFGLPIVRLPCGL